MNEPKFWYGRNRGVEYACPLFSSDEIVKHRTIGGEVVDQYDRIASEAEGGPKGLLSWSRARKYWFQAMKNHYESDGDVSAIVSALRVADELGWLSFSEDESDGRVFARGTQKHSGTKCPTFSALNDVEYTFLEHRYDRITNRLNGRKPRDTEKTIPDYEAREGWFRAIIDVANAEKHHGLLSEKSYSREELVDRGVRVADELGWFEL